MWRSAILGSGMMFLNARDESNQNSSLDSGKGSRWMRLHDSFGRIVLIRCVAALRSVKIIRSQKTSWTRNLLSNQ